MLLGNDSHSQTFNGEGTLFVDQNYREVGKERDAAFVITYSANSDSVHFETFSRNPKSLYEKGVFPNKNGYDFRNCAVIRFWPNRKIRAIGQLNKSYCEGPWTYFDEEGVLYSKVYYKNGVINGEAVRFYENGKKRISVFEFNKKQGDEVIVDSAGNVLYKGNYKNDSLVGTVLYYNNVGKVVRKSFYNSGVLRFDTTYWPGDEVFACESYDQNGLLHGKSFVYTVRGKISRYDEYRHGELLQSICMHPLALQQYDEDDCPPRKEDARFPGGMAKFEEYIRNNQDYPEDAIKWKQQGLVEFEFTISQYGTVYNLREVNLIPLGYGIEKECLRLLERANYFEPAKMNGVPVETTFKIPFVFILQE